MHEWRRIKNSSLYLTFNTRLPLECQESIFLVGGNFIKDLDQMDLLRTQEHRAINENIVALMDMHPELKELATRIRSKELDSFAMMATPQSCLLRFYREAALFEALNVSSRGELIR